MEITLEDLDEMAGQGYEDVGDIKALLIDIELWPLPYKGDMVEKIKWVEFCRSLVNQNFTSGETFYLNGIEFFAL